MFAKDEMGSEFEEPIEMEITVADLTRSRSDVPRENRALEPVKTSLERAGFYAYGTFDDQQRWTIAVDDELGSVGVSIGDDGFVVEMWATSPGLFSDEENEWKRRSQERLARRMIPAIARGSFAAHQTAYWDEVDLGVGVKTRYELPFSRSSQIGGFVREHLPELEELIEVIESGIGS
jgi:hypothetical protein